MDSYIKIYIIIGNEKDIIPFINKLNPKIHKPLFVRNMGMDQILDLNEEEDQ